MEQYAFIILQTRDIRPPPRIQYTRSIDEDVAGIANGVPSIVTSNLNIPVSFILVPGSFSNLMLEPAVFAKVIFVAEILKVKRYFI